MTEAVIDQPQQDPPKQPYVYRKPRQKRIKKALAGALLAQGGQTFDEIAPQVGAKNGNSLKRSLFRDGVTITKLRNNPAPAVLTSLTAQVVNEATQALNDRFNKEITRQLTAIEGRPVEYEDLPSRGQGRTATVKQLAEAFRSVNGNPDSVTFQFGAERQSVTPQVERIEPLPVVDCGSSTVQEPTQSTLPVQDTQG